MTTVAALARELEFTVHVIDEIHAAAGRIGFRPNDLPQIYAISLHVTIVELLSACFLLAEKQQGTGMPILLRSMYEALVDLDNLVRDASYVDHLNAANLKQLVKIVEQARIGNPGLRGLDAKWDLPATLDMFRTQLSALKQAGKAKLEIWEKCQRVGRKHEYDSLYGLFCMDSHNNVASLMERHVTMEEGNTTISFFRDPDVVAICSRLSFALQFAIASARMVHGALRTNAPEPDALAEQYWKERATWGLPLNEKGPPEGGPQK